MHTGTYVFAEIMTLLPRHTFDMCVARYNGSRYQKSFSCRDQFLAMAFGQLAYRESLRDVVTCLASHERKLYHLGFKCTVAKTTLARANEKRDWRIYRDLAQSLIGEARALYIDEPAVASDIESACYAIDSTSIDLCLSLFPWAPYVHARASVKLHVVMDMRGSIPTFFRMTGGMVNDVNFLDDVAYEPGAFYVMDRGYLDFERLHAKQAEEEQDQQAGRRPNTTRSLDERFLVLDIAAREAPGIAISGRRRPPSNEDLPFS